MLLLVGGRIADLRLTASKRSTKPDHEARIPLNSLAMRSWSTRDDDHFDTWHMWWDCSRTRKTYVEPGVA